MRIFRRPPDFIVGGADHPYMRRWWVIPRNRRFNIYLHNFLRSDDDRALHDHPWWNVSILLTGSYVEHRQDGSVRVRKAWRPWAPWRLTIRSAEAAHRIELVEGANPVWTLFITGPVVREWGFHCPKGWRHWRIFVSERDAGAVGLGCDD